MASPLSKYSFINAKLRARISKILPDETFSQLAKAPFLDEALALLRETPFAGLEEIYSATGDLKQAELELLKNEIELYPIFFTVTSRKNWGEFMVYCCMICIFIFCPVVQLDKNDCHLEWI